MKGGGTDTNGRLRFFPVYAMGFFSLSVQPMAALIIPLWALSLGASPLMVGLSVSAGAVLPSVFAITSGAMIDRLGSKAVLRISTLTIAAMALLYPLFPLISVLLVLQLFFGQIQSMNWISAQTYVARLDRQSGNNRHAGNFSFAVSLGNFVAPLTVGFAWDYWGPWASFGCVSAWCLCLWVSAFMLPAENEGKENGTRQQVKLSSLLPRWQHYQRALSLFVLPAVVVVIYASFMRLSNSSIRNSFYMVYLEQIDFTASQIATMLACWSLAGTFSSLASGLLLRFFKSGTLMFMALVVSILPLTLTPLFTGYWQQLAIIFISGFGTGLTLPLMISMLGNAVDSDAQGIAVGLRSSANYLAAFLIPLLFGLSVQVAGLEASFYIMGALLLVPMLFIAPALLRNHRRNGSDAEVG